MSLNPAKILGLDRGVIAPGKAADLAVVDVSESTGSIRQSLLPREEIRLSAE